MILPVALARFGREIKLFLFVVPLVAVYLDGSIDSFLDSLADRM